ncbi:hypothetical protein [Streptomyces sp. NBC_01594]|uniref:hypothetical protein n=1 Tax=Streptomyces sp. NBC_01594 TaxID=2975890 RepID=UPI003868825D
MFTHPESEHPPGWVLIVERAWSDNFPREPITEPTRLLMSIDSKVTRVEIVHPEVDEPEDVLMVRLTVDVAEQLVLVLRELVANDTEARVHSDAPCVHCGGLGRALPLWRTR